jgi:hypothetical protein
MDAMKRKSILREGTRLDIFRNGVNCKSSVNGVSIPPQFSKTSEVSSRRVLGGLILTVTFMMPP